MASVIKRGGVWYAKWTDATGRCRREPTQARSKTEAKALADELEVEPRRRRSLVQRARNGLPPRPEDLTGTLAELCTWWLDHRCPEASKSGEQHRLRKHVLSARSAPCPSPRSVLPRSTSCSIPWKPQAYPARASTSSAASCTLCSRKRRRPANG